MYGNQGGYGQPGQQPGYGAPGQQPGYGAPGQQPGYGAPGQQRPGQQPGYGAPGGQPGYGAPGGQPGYGAPGQQRPGQQPGYGAPGGQPGYGAPGGQPGYGQPGQQPGYGSPGAGHHQAGGQPGYGAPGAGHQAGGHGQVNYNTQSYQPTASQLQGWGGTYYQQLSPHEIEDMKKWFAAVDKDRSGTISASELSSMQFGGKRLSLKTAKMLVAVFDTDFSGHVGFFEYCALHKFITSLQQSFAAHDRDRSGKLDIHEVHTVLSSMPTGGFPFSQNTILQVYKRFEKKGFANRTGGLDFETFMQMSAYLSQVRSTFSAIDTDRDGWIRINLETLVQMSVSMPTLQV